MSTNPETIDVHIPNTNDITELAKLGVLFKDDTLKFHMMLSIGREDDKITRGLNKRRMDVADRMKVLQDLLDL